jgi:TrpR-related protein YerC/YecD
METIKSPETDKLFEAILSLRNIDECYDFFTDICTIKEMTEMSSRFTVACMLTDGKVYTEIARETGTSTATISRVNRCLQHGCDGYKKAIERISEDDTK